MTDYPEPGKTPAALPVPLPVPLPEPLVNAVWAWRTRMIPRTRDQWPEALREAVEYLEASTSQE